MTPSSNDRDSVINFCSTLQGCGRVSLPGSLWLAHWQLRSGSYMMQWKFGCVCQDPHHPRCQSHWSEN